MSTKSKSILNSKSTPTTPRTRVSRGTVKSDADSHLRCSVDKSARSVTSRRITTLPADKKATRILKPSELHAAQEDLKLAKEKLALVEKEKAQALEEAKEAQKLANEKLREALLAQKQAKENSEIEEFRAVEMEQVGIEAFQKKEEEIEAVRNQHAVDVAALLSTTQELQRAKRELAIACDAKNQALANAEDAEKSAVVHAEKVGILSAELVRLKSLLDSRKAWDETEANERNKLNLEIETLKQQLHEAKSYEPKLVEKEGIVKQLNVDLEAAKMAESYAHNVMEEWKKKVEELESQAVEAHHSERSASVMLDSIMEQLEASNDLLHDAESEIASLKEKIGVLEMSLTRQKEESQHYVQMAKEEASEMARKVDFLVSDLETVEEEKIQAIKNEKLAADGVQTLLEEKNRLINDLERSWEEEEKSNKAMESLVSALHEVSSEAKKTKERLLSSQTEYETQIGDLKLELKETKEKYETLLDEANEKLDVLTNSFEHFEELKAEWVEKEFHLMSCMKKTEEQNAMLEEKISRLVKDAQVGASAKRNEEANLKNSLKKAESEVTYLKDVLGEAEGESMRLKERLEDKENEVQNILRENEELRSREAVSLNKVEELSLLLERSLAKIAADVSPELSDSEKDYDMLPKVVKFSEQNGGGRIEKPKMEHPPYQSVEEELLSITSDDEPIMASIEVENSNGKLNGNDDKGFSQGRKEEEEKSDAKANGGKRHDQIDRLSSKENVENGGTSPTKQNSLKKKKPLFHKFGSLLKKKNANSHK